jgi:hypothetical protein
MCYRMILTGIFKADVCKDGRINAYQKNTLFQTFRRQTRAQCKGKCAAKERRRAESSQKIPMRTRALSRNAFAGQLIKSRDLGQNTVETCNSKNSTVPKFFSYHGGQFCNMEKRKLYPPCEASDETGCFDD